MAAVKIHADHRGWAMCGCGNKLQLTKDPALVTCGLCQRLLKKALLKEQTQPRPQNSERLAELQREKDALLAQMQIALDERRYASRVRAAANQLLQHLRGVPITYHGVARGWDLSPEVNAAMNALHDLLMSRDVS